MEDLRVSQIVNMNSIRYTRLDKLCKVAFAKLDVPSEINIFIDLNCILHRLYNNSSILHLDPIEIASNIINLAGHYMYYFYGLSEKVNVHLVLGAYSPPHNRELLYNYNEKKVNKIIHDVNTDNIVKTSLDMIKTLSKSIPNLYYNTTIYECGVLMYHILQTKTDKNSLNIVITTDSYNYQLADEGVFVFRPYKTGRGEAREDKSYIVYPNNPIQTVCTERRRVLDKGAFNGMNINGKLYSLFLALSGCPERNISSSGMKVNNIVKYIYDSINNGYIINGYNVLLLDDKFVQDSPVKDLCTRYYAIDIPTQYKSYTASSDVNSVKFQDQYDSITLNNINNNVFEKYPMILSNFGV